MSEPLFLFDLVLAGAIVAIATAALLVRDAFAMIVLFVVFGLMSALAWVRLAAPDVALAEAAIGTGLTGALLLKTLHHLRVRGMAGWQPGPAAAGPVPALVGWLNAGLAVAIVAGLGLAILGSPLRVTGLEIAVSEAMPLSGVENPVTAVLLNFRAYDTLMEVVVLLAAIIVVWQVERGTDAAPAPSLGPIWQGFARLTLPAAALVGVYLLWAGAEAPGGAFQGGAMLAAIGLMMLLTGLYRPHPDHRRAARLLFVLGTVAFAATALLVAGGGRASFEYPQGHAKTLILLIEGLVTISIAVTLTALFHGREPAPLKGGHRHEP